MTIAKVPEPFEPLFAPYEFKGFHGGRGSAKSHSFATALLIMASQQPLRWLCAREIQRSIAQSVHQLFREKIRELNIAHLWNPVQTEIRGTNGSCFLFSGTRTNPDGIQSLEGLNGAWFEEGQRASQRSLDILLPTLRQPWPDGRPPEFWSSWNPQSPKDPIDKLFRHKPPPNSFVRHVNYDENPFFPDNLRRQMKWDRNRDKDRYRHIWLGEYRQQSDAQVFKNWVVEEFDPPPEGTRFYFGADWGYSVDPTVLVRCWVDGRTVYVDHEAWAVCCAIDHIPALFAGDDPREQKRWQNPLDWPGIPGALNGWPIVADSARPETIAYVKKRGFNIRGARKGQGSVEDGVEFLKSFDIVVHPRCTRTIDELTYYSWKVDERTEEVLPILLDKKNHVIDSLRYALENFRRAIATSVGVGSITRLSPNRI